MTLALADAQTLLFFGILSSNDGDYGRAAVIQVGVAAIFFVGFVGLYRLRLWGALLNLVTAIVFGLIVLTRVVRFNHEISLLLMAVCVTQVLAAAPMMIGLARGKPLHAAPPLFGQVAAPLVVIALMMLSSGLALAECAGSG